MQQCFKALLLTDETFQHQELKAFGYIQVWPNGKFVKKKSLQLGVLTSSHTILPLKSNTYDNLVWLETQALASVWTHSQTQKSHRISQRLKDWEMED